MTNEEAFNLMLEVWYKFKDVELSHLTSYQVADIEGAIRLIKDMVEQ